MNTVLWNAGKEKHIYIDKKPWGFGTFCTKSQGVSRFQPLDRLIRSKKLFGISHCGPPG